MKELLEDLTKEFADPDFAHGYMQSHAISRIAAQIHAIRKQRGWTQAELAKRSGIAQERISLLESADFDSITLKTLHKLSKAFDVDVRVSFCQFSSGILDVIKLSQEKLCVPSREDDLTAFQKNITRPFTGISISKGPTVTTGTNFSNTAITGQTIVSKVEA